MMNNDLLCPECAHRLRPEIEVGLCAHCGWTDDSNQRAQDRSLHRRIILTFAVLSFLLAGTFVHTTKWAEYSVTVIPLQIKQLLNIATPDESKQLGEICKARRSVDCLIATYKNGVLNHTDDIEFLKLYAKALQDKKLYDQALESYSLYRQGGGEDVLALLNYARLLGQKGHTQESEQIFKEILSTQPNVLQITVLKSFIKMYVDNQLYKQAEKWIKKTQRRGENTGTFMNYELDQIKKLMASQ